VSDRNATAKIFSCQKWKTREETGNYKDAVLHIPCPIKIPLYRWIDNHYLPFFRFIRRNPEGKAALGRPVQNQA